MLTFEKIHDIYYLCSYMHKGKLPERAGRKAKGPKDALHRWQPVAVRVNLDVNLNMFTLYATDLNRGSVFFHLKSRGGAAISRNNKW